MFYSKQLVFSFNENSFNIAIVSKLFGKTKIESIETFNPVFNNGSFIYDTESNVEQVDKFLSENNISTKSVDAVVSLEGIITRLIEVPFLGKDDLKKFVFNNLSEYFTVNINDYYFDYKVINYNGRKSKTINIVLCAFPKVRLKDIHSFVESCDLIPKRITIYPDSVSNIFKYLKEQSVAILDLNSNKSHITILTKGSIFLHLPLEKGFYADNKEPFIDIIENAGYFLNFYSTRHFGNKVDQIYLIGEQWDNRELYKYIEGQFQIQTVAGIADNELKIKVGKDIDINKNCEILGTVINTKEFYNKSINFSKIIKEKSERVLDLTYLKLGTILLIITAVTWILTFVYCSVQFNRYDTSGLNDKVKQVDFIENKIASLSQENKKYEDKEKNLRIIEQDKFNYIAYFDILRKGLPSDISINKISFDKDKIHIILKISKAIDKMRIVVAINNLEVFEPIQLETIKLDDSEKEVEFALVIKKIF